MKRIKEGFSVSIKEIVDERGRVLIILDQRVSGLIYLKNELLRRDIEAWVLRVRDTKNLCRWSFLASLKMRESMR